MKKLIGDPNLDLVEMPALEPPEANVDPVLMQKYQQEFAEAQSTALPDEEEEI